jgi:nitrogen fixation NifU-like protein
VEGLLLTLTEERSLRGLLTPSLRYVYKMDANLSALYQEVILDHYRRPRNKGTLSRADAAVMMKNPLCGDEVEVQLVFDGERVADVKFTGQGCSISQASTSIMTELVKGKSAEEVVALRNAFRAMVMGEGAPDETVLGRAMVLSGVSKYPARVKCALLGWNAVEEGIRQHDDEHKKP